MIVNSLKIQDHTNHRIRDTPIFRCDLSLIYAKSVNTQNETQEPDWENPQLCERLVNRAPKPPVYVWRIHFVLLFLQVKYFRDTYAEHPEDRENIEYGVRLRDDRALVTLSGMYDQMKELGYELSYARSEND